MRYIIVFLALSVSLPVWAGVEISGHVLGPDGKPAAGVMVVVRHGAAGRSLAGSATPRAPFPFPRCLPEGSACSRAGKGWARARR